jgi:hypothetical protein
MKPESAEATKCGRKYLEQSQSLSDQFCMVRPEGLEPPTLGSEGAQSTLEKDSDQGGQIDMFSL